MKHYKTIPLNPVFGDTSTSKLITMIEESCVFKSAALEAELTARLERSGRKWRFATPTRIELYFPGKTHRSQKPCNVGLFNDDALAQLDVADLIPAIGRDQR